MDTHLYQTHKTLGRASVELTSDGQICICRTIYDRETGVLTEEHSSGITLDELYRRRDVTARDLASLDALIADAEAAGAKRTQT